MTGIPKAYENANLACSNRYKLTRWLNDAVRAGKNDEYMKDFIEYINRLALSSPYAVAQALDAEIKKLAKELRLEWERRNGVNRRTPAIEQPNASDTTPKLRHA